MGHHCHALGCNTPCEPEKLMCLLHWRMVPASMQRAVWNAYRPGQCDDKDPSPRWHEAADYAIAAVAEREGFREGAKRLKKSAREWGNKARAEEMADG